MGQTVELFVLAVFCNFFLLSPNHKITKMYVDFLVVFFLSVYFCNRFQKFSIEIPSVFCVNQTKNLIFLKNYPSINLVFVLRVYYGSLRDFFAAFYFASKSHQSISSILIHKRTHIYKTMTCITHLMQTHSEIHLVYLKS